MKKFILMLIILSAFQSAQSFEGNIKWMKSWLCSNPYSMKYSYDHKFIITLDAGFIKFWDLKGNIIKIAGPFYNLDKNTKMEIIPESNDILIIAQKYIYYYSYDENTMSKTIDITVMSEKEYILDYELNHLKDTVIITYYSSWRDFQQDKLFITNGIRIIDVKSSSKIDLKANNYVIGNEKYKNNIYISFSEKRNIIAVYNDSGSVSILDYHSGNLLRALTLKQSGITGLVFSDDSKYVCISDAKGNIFTWDWEIANNINSYKFSNGRAQVIKTDELDNKIQIKYTDIDSTHFDLYVKFDPMSVILSDSLLIDKKNFKDYYLENKSGNIIATNENYELFETSYDSQDSIINKICEIHGNIQTVSTDWSVAYISGNYSFIDVMELDSGKLLKRIGEKRNINSIFDSDLLRGSKNLATLQSKSIRLWDTYNDSCLFDVNYGDAIKSIRFRNSDSLLFISGNFGAGIGLEIPSGIKAEEIKTGDTWSTKLDISESGIISAIGHCLYGQNDIQINNYLQGKSHVIYTNQVSNGCSGIINLKICPNDKMLFASFWLDWGIARYIVYDLSTYSPLFPFVGVGDLHIDASAFTSDSRVLIMGCDDATIRFSKTDVPEIKRTIRTPSAVRSLSISPNDDLLLATTFDGSIIMYDITSEIILTDIDSDSNDQKYHGISISPNPTPNIIKIQNLDNSLQSLASDIDISIYNSLGVQMLSLCGQSAVNIGGCGIDVSQFPQGIYNVIISSKNNVWYSKFIKIE